MTKAENETTTLVKQSDVAALAAQLLTAELGVVQDIEAVLPYITTQTVRGPLERRLARGKECVEVLRAGFVPVNTGWFMRTDTTSKWNKAEVTAILKSMPDDVKEVWERVKDLKIFKSFSVSHRGADPMLVGNAGGKHFFIAGWWDFGPSTSLGIRIRI